MYLLELLKKEHRKLKEILNYLEIAADRVETGGFVSPLFFQGIIELTSLLIRDYHQHLEGEILASFLQTKGLAIENDPLRALKNEHEEAEQYIEDLKAAVRSLEKGNDPERARAEIIDNIRAYIRLMAAHTSKEEMMLFPIVDSISSPEEMEALQRRVKRYLEELNINLTQFFTEKLNTLRGYLGGAEEEREEIRRLWKLMHE